MVYVTAAISAGEKQIARALDRKDIASRVLAKIGDIPHTTQRYRFVAMNMIAECMCELSINEL